ncbi:MAG: ABC transporter ATP-binding protein [Candidatus Asgardarchaeia archaeon]
MPEIELRNVSKRYGNFYAVKRINLRVEDGEYATLLGPSGCGKTTTLKIIAGLKKPDEGEVWINGRLVNDVPPEDRGIGFVFQHFAVFPFMNVWENVTYGLRIRGVDLIKIEKAAWDAIELVGLTDKILSYPNQLEAHELQKVGLARALATGSKILLLDEPLSLLDFKVREKFRYDIRRLTKELGITVIHVTHDQEEAMSVSDKIIVMKKGEIVQIGKPVELYESPKKLFVANFVGESNFYIGKIVEISKNGIIIETREGIKFKSEYKEGFVHGEKVVLAIRKESGEVVKDDVEDEFNVVSGVVTFNRYLGSISRVRIRIDKRSEIEIKKIPKTVSSYSVGSKISLKYSPKDVHVFHYPKEGLEEALSVT